MPASPTPRFSPNICMPLKIFAGHSKHLPVFVIGTEYVVRGVVVLVCGKKKKKKKKVVENRGIKKTGQPDFILV